MRVLVFPLNCTFQSTPSAWRETLRPKVERNDRCISIHSLRMEGDKLWKCGYDQRFSISIHSLRMEGDKRIF